MTYLTLKKVSWTFDKRKALSIELEKKFLTIAYSTSSILRSQYCGPNDSSVQGFTIAPSHILNNTYRGVFGWMNR